MVTHITVDNSINIVDNSSKLWITHHITKYLMTHTPTYGTHLEHKPKIHYLLCGIGKSVELYTLIQLSLGIESYLVCPYIPVVTYLPLPMVVKDDKRQSIHFSTASTTTTIN